MIGRRPASKLAQEWGSLRWYLLAPSEWSVGMCSYDHKWWTESTRSSSSSHSYISIKNKAKAPAPLKASRGIVLMTRVHPCWPSFSWSSGPTCEEMVQWLLLYTHTYIYVHSSEYYVCTCLRRVCLSVWVCVVCVKGGGPIPTRLDVMAVKKVSL